MRKPIRAKGVPQGKINKSDTLIAPVKGWYVGANITNAPKGTAYILDNCFPQYDYVRARKGSQAYATGMANSPVKSLMTYTSGTVAKLFAANGSSIFDVSATGAVGAAVKTGLLGLDFSFTQFTTTGGTFLVAVNGTDNVQLYDGTTWADASITGTGFVSANMIGVWQFKSRIFLLEKNTLKVWYLPVDSIGGTATALPLGGIFPLGGSLIAGYSWAISSNSGLYETCVFITDQGEVAFYDGAGPAATDWSLKGVFRISRPLGRNCLMKAGGDVAIMTEDGIVPLSSVMTLDQIALQNAAVTLPIAPAWRDAVIGRRGLSGWSITTWPLESMAIVNLPQINSNDRVQFVANARSGAWARWTGWDARCFAIYNNNLYYGTSDGRVMQGEVTGRDDGKPYTAVCAWSFTDLGQKSLRKQVKMMRPIIQTTLATAPSFQILADYDSTLNPAPSAALVLGGGFTWDVSKWDQANWGATIYRSAAWKALSGLGVALAPVMQMTLSSTDDPDVRLTQLDLVYEVGDIFG